MRKYTLRSKPVTTPPESKAAQQSDAGSRDSATGTDAGAYLSRGDWAYLKIVEAESGREISAEAFERKKAERDLLMQQSLRERQAEPPKAEREASAFAAAAEGPWGIAAV